MSDLFELISWLGDLLHYWRLFISLVITTGLVFLTFAVIHDEQFRWVICSPLVLVGVILGLRWQFQSGRT